LCLGAALRGKLEHPFYCLSDDDRQSEQFSRAQHNGSLGPAVLLAKRQDFSGAVRLLDVAGGSGAFSITLCKRYPGLQATVLDFPRMTRVAQQYVQEASLCNRPPSTRIEIQDSVW
jgi:tRNA1(Val) A37 N6-methylase TrmN6